VNETLSLIFFDSETFSVAVIAEAVSSFTSLSKYTGDAPLSSFPDFLISSGIVTASYRRATHVLNSFIMFVSDETGHLTGYLTPPPSELIEYTLSDLYPLPPLIEDVSAVQGLSAYCLFKNKVFPVIQPQFIKEQVHYSSTKASELSNKDSGDLHNDKDGYCHRPTAKVVSNV